MLATLAKSLDFPANVPGAPGREAWLIVALLGGRVDRSCIESIVHKHEEFKNINWLVVSTYPKNTSQNGNLLQVGLKITNI